MAQERDIGRDEAATLAGDAATDDAALAELRSITSVDDGPVDLAAVTRDLGDERVARLEALAAELAEQSSPGAADRVDTTDEARGRARTVLDAEKFQQSEVPKPFKGALEWLADRLRPVGRFFTRLVEPILALPGGAFILGTALGAVAAVALTWLVGRRSRAAVRTAGVRGSLVDAAADPVDLVRRAEEREQAGDFDGAIRLRYQAGLIRLVRADRLILRADTTAADAAHQVGHPAMDAITSDFEEIVYGNRGATVADVSHARQRWADLLMAGSRS